MIVCICPRKYLIFSGLTAPGCASTASIASCGPRGAADGVMSSAASRIGGERRGQRAEAGAGQMDGTLRDVELIRLLGRKSAYSNDRSASQMRSSHTFFFRSSRIGLQTTAGVPRSHAALGVPPARGGAHGWGGAQVLRHLEQKSSSHTLDFGIVDAAVVSDKRIAPSAPVAWLLDTTAARRATLSRCAWTPR